MRGILALAKRGVDTLGRLQTVQWLIPGVATIVVTALAVVQRLPWAVTFALIIVVFMAMLMGVNEWNRIMARRRRGAADRPLLSLSVSCEEIVIGGVSIITSGGSGSATAPGTYLVAKGFALTNRSDAPVTLSVRLRIKLRDGWTVASQRRLDRPGPSLSDPFFSAHESFLSALGEPALQHPVNLEPRRGNAGRMTFYLNMALQNDAATVEDISTCDMEWKIHDSQSGEVKTYAVARTRNRWRVLLR